MLIRNNIIPIFAIETDYVELYEQLSNHMTQLSDVGVLSPVSFGFGVPQGYILGHCNADP